MDLLNKVNLSYASCILTALSYLRYEIFRKDLDLEAFWVFRIGTLGLHSNVHILKAGNTNDHNTLDSVLRPSFPLKCGVLDGTILTGNGERKCI